jgi:hypothetical protein
MGNTSWPLLAMQIPLSNTSQVRVASRFLIENEKFLEGSPSLFTVDGMDYSYVKSYLGIAFNFIPENITFPTPDATVPTLQSKNPVFPTHLDRRLRPSRWTHREDSQAFELGTTMLKVLGQSARIRHYTLVLTGELRLWMSTNRYFRTKSQP